MRILAIIFIFVSALSYAQEANYSSYHLVFDIDWTLSYQLKDDDVVKDSSKIIHYEGQRFRVTDLAGELIQALLERYPRINISFYSGGQEARNLLFLEAIKLPNGQTAKDIYTNLYSRQDLEVVSEAKELSFADRNKKVLYNRIQNYDGAKVLLIDDLLKFSDYMGTKFEIQNSRHRLNTLFSYGRISFYEDSQGFDNRANKQHDPISERHYFLERNKAVLMFGIIDEAFEMEKKGLGSFSDNVVKLHIDPDTRRPYEITSPQLEPFFERGFEVFSRYTSKKKALNQTKARIKRKPIYCKAITL